MFTWLDVLQLVCGTPASVGNAGRFLVVELVVAPPEDDVDDAFLPMNWCSLSSAAGLPVHCDNVSTTLKFWRADRLFPLLPSRCLDGRKFWRPLLFDGRAEDACVMCASSCAVLLPFQHCLCRMSKISVIGGTTTACRFMVRASTP